nr:MAG TPA: hypothetical protein [Caudoviricetes sp.]DAP70857.1 MAG TPA: hypothetical protein [Caudoviricetes sp.]
MQILSLPAFSNAPSVKVFRSQTAFHWQKCCRTVVFSGRTAVSAFCPCRLPSDFFAPDGGAAAPTSENFFCPLRTLLLSNAFLYLP